MGKNFCFFSVFVWMMLTSGLLSVVSGTNAHKATEDEYSRGGFDFFYQDLEYPRDCKAVIDRCHGQPALSGVYQIKPIGASNPFQVFCNNSIDDGGWTVIQRRLDGSVDFNRYWRDYKDGFGFLNREFWLGNDKISLMTNQRDYELRIDITDLFGASFFAKFDLFRISDEFSRYKLVAIDGYNSSISTVGYHGLPLQRNKLFSTRDQDNDGWADYNCAERHMGGWWYSTWHTFRVNSTCQNAWTHCDYFATGDGCAICSGTQLNGVYDSRARGTNIHWTNLDGDENDCEIKYTEMKIRPVG